MMSLFILCKFIFILPIVLPKSNAHFESTNTHKLLSGSIFKKISKVSFSGEHLCPQLTIGNRSYNTSERAYILNNVTSNSKSGQSPWDILTVYQYPDQQSNKLENPKCIFKRLWIKQDVKTNNSLNVDNVTLHSIFQRKIPGNLDTGEHCTNFVKFLQMDLQNDLVWVNLQKTEGPPRLSFKCNLEDRQKTENTSANHLSTKELTLTYFTDKMKFQLSADSDANYPVLMFVFRVQSETSCFLQVQQHLLLKPNEIECNKDITRRRLRRVCAQYEDYCSNLEHLIETINGHYDGPLTYDYEDEYTFAKEETGGFFDLTTTELFLKGLIFPTLILWAAHLGYILLKRRMMRQNATLANDTTATAPRYPDFPPPSYEHATCLPTYQEAMSKTLCPDGSSMTNSAKTDAVEIEINNKAASESSLPECL